MPTQKQAVGLALASLVGGTILAYGLVGGSIPFDVWVECIAGAAALFYGLALLWGVL